MINRETVIHAIGKESVFVGYNKGTQPVKYDAATDRFLFNGIELSWQFYRAKFSAVDDQETKPDFTELTPTDETLAYLYAVETHFLIAQEKEAMFAPVKHLVEFYNQKENAKKFDTQIDVYVLKDVRCKERGKGSVLISVTPDVKTKGQRISGYMYDAGTETLSYETVAAWRFAKVNIGQIWSATAGPFDQFIMEQYLATKSNEQ